MLRIFKKTKLDYLCYNTGIIALSKSRWDTLYRDISNNYIQLLDVATQLQPRGFISSTGLKVHQQRGCHTLLYLRERPATSYFDNVQKFKCVQKYGTYMVTTLFCVKIHSLNAYFQTHTFRPYVEGIFHKWNIHTVYRSTTIRDITYTLRLRTVETLGVTFDENVVFETISNTTTCGRILENKRKIHFDAFTRTPLINIYIL